MLLKLVTRFLVVVLALLLSAHLIPGIEVAGLYTALIVAVLLGVINITIKPLLLVLTLPITLITLGLFALVLNALLFWFIASFVEGFSVSGFLPAFAGALLVSIFSWIGHKLT